MLQGLKGPSIWRDVEVNLPMLVMVIFYHLLYPVATFLCLDLSFLSEGYLWIRYPCVHALIHVSFTLSVSNKDYPSRPWWNNHFLQGGSSKDIGNKGLLEIVSIDSRIRLYEARFPMVLLEFLALLSERNILRLSLSSGRKLMSTILSSLLSSMFR